MLNSLQTVLNKVITSSGLRWQVRQTLAADDLTPALRLVVASHPTREYPGWLPVHLKHSSWHWESPASSPHPTWL
jgi:hypothetical protein